MSECGVELCEVCDGHPPYYGVVCEHHDCTCDDAPTDSPPSPVPSVLVEEGEREKALARTAHWFAVKAAILLDSHACKDGHDDAECPDRQWVRMGLIRLEAALVGYGLRSLTDPCTYPGREALKLNRDVAGRVVRVAWVEWARQQPDPKPHWLEPWEALDEPMREVDRRIGESVIAAALSPSPATRTQEVEHG